MSDEWDAFDEDDDDDDCGTDIVNCPCCAAEIYADAPQCPICGEYVTHSSRPLANMPHWAIVLGLLGIAAVVVALLGGF